MIIALAGFVVFLAALVAGVVWLLRQDTNSPDTEMTLALNRFTSSLRQVSRSVTLITSAARGYNESMLALQRAFARSK